MADYSSSSSKAQVCPLAPIRENPFGHDPWRIREESFAAANLAQRESLFALGNGQLGIRGQFEEGYPDQYQANSIAGTYWNGLYVRRPIEYGESAPGFPESMDFMPSILCGRGLDIRLDGQRLNERSILAHTRELDFSRGLSQRETLWGDGRTELVQSPALQIKVRTLVSMQRPGLIAQRIELKAEQDCSLTLSMALRASTHHQTAENDPRVSAGAQDQLAWIDAQSDTGRCEISAAQRAVNGVIRAQVLLQCRSHSLQATAWQEDTALGLRFERALRKGETLSFDRAIRYSWRPVDARVAKADVASSIDLNASDVPSFDDLAKEQAEHWQDFWRQADIGIPGQPELEQALRFNAFQLRQSCSRNPAASIAAKGLTGPGYEGHYFWDSEIYALPYFSLVEPEVARELLRYRIQKLPQARQRARQMSHVSGALYPWRTISGDECSAFFPAGTAQYHINADIAHAVFCYLRDTGDWSFVLDEAAEMLFETAKIWLDIGHFNEQQEGRFTIHCVTGPDEYTALVNNNYYTNLMAAAHLKFSASVAAKLAQERPQQWARLREKLHLSCVDLERWRLAAELIHLPQDCEQDISWQDDHFAQRPLWNKKRFPLDETPLLLKHHPLVLYRHRILKQADVLMAHLLCPEHSDWQRKLNDFQYYEPLTTHDSSLSACVHSILACWTQQTDLALKYLRETVRSDLADLHGNARHGLHIAAMAGSLACLYQGFAGIHLRHAKNQLDDASGESLGTLYLQPCLPQGWQAYHLSFQHRGSLLLLEMNASTEEGQQADLKIQLISGPAITLHVFDQALSLSINEPEHKMSIA